jgi:hypothetical protein
MTAYIRKKVRREELGVVVGGCLPLPTGWKLHMLLVSLTITLEKKQVAVSLIRLFLPPQYLPSSG